MRLSGDELAKTVFNIRLKYLVNSMDYDFHRYKSTIDLLRLLRSLEVI